MPGKTISATLCRCVFLCVMAVLLLSSCGGAPTSDDGGKGQGALISQQGKSVATTSATKSGTATATPEPDNVIATPTAEPTETPTPLPDVTVSWTTGTTLYVIGQANIRSAPYTESTLIKTVDTSQTLTEYGTVNGEILSAGATWYRVSAQGSDPEYVYSDLVTTTKPQPVSTTPQKEIKVNLTTQHIYAYEDGKQVYDGLITSGQPGLLTPTGTFSIISKLHPTVFYSPWPKSSPYYYDPLNINYALGFQGTLLFLHDATWRGNDFGPGTNVPHTAANGQQMTGSHGCVEMPVSESQWFYNWAPIGTPLIIAY